MRSSSDSSNSNNNSRFHFLSFLLVAISFILFGDMYCWQNAPVAQAATQTVSTCDETHLDAAISTASAGDTVNFSCSGIITLTSTLNISKDLTLSGDGQNITLNGNRVLGILSVGTNTSLTLNSINLINGLAHKGGGVYNDGILTVTNSTFSLNSSAGADGGAIYNSGLGTINIISNSSFLQNNGWGGYGGAVTNDGGTIKNINNSSFISNTATYGSSAIINQEGGIIENIENSIFSANQGGPDGAITNYGGTINNIINSTFTDNSAIEGGAIYNWVGIINNISNVTFKLNSSSYTGGAILNTSTINNITNSTFVSNTAVDGAAIALNDQGTINNLSNSTFSNNSTTQHGGAIYNYGVIKIRNSIFVRSSNDQSCAGFIPVDDQDFNLSDDNSCNFNATNSRNGVTNLNLGTLGNYGGSTETIPLLAGSGAIGTVKTYCPATDQRGVARPANNCDVGAFQTGIIGNGTDPSLCTEPALNAALGAGGYISVQCPPSTTITVTANPDTTSNFRAISGSVTVDASPSVSFTLSGSGTFELFSVITGANFTVNNLSLTKGNSTYGGVISNTGTANIISSSIYSNFAFNGGAIYSNIGSSLTISNSNFFSDNAASSGGAVFIISGTMTVYDSNFASNYVNSGAGVFEADNSTVSISKSNFVSNFGGGNGVISNDGSVVSIDESNFISNTAGGGGGAINNYNAGRIDINSSNFSFNVSISYYGGAIFNSDTGSSVFITNSTFSENSVFNQRNGGAIFNQDPESNVTVSDSTFAFNNGIAGSAITNWSGNLTITKNIFVTKTGLNCANGGNVNDLGYNLSNDNSCISASTSISNVTNFNLGTLGYYGGATQTVPLLTGSKAIGFVATGCPATDQRGVVRPATNCAAGAFEIASSFVSLASSHNPSRYGQPVTFTATVSPTNATGIISFTLNSAIVTGTLTNGTATYVTSTLPVGSTIVTATYNGDLSYTASTSNFVTQTVNPDNTNITVNSSANPSTYSQTVTFTATIGVNTSSSVVQPHVTGDNTVSFTIDGNTVATELPVINNTATYVTSTLSTGSHSLVANYTGSATNNPSTSSFYTQTVSQATPSVSLVSSTSVITQGQSVIFTATVNSNVGSPRGTVTFFDGATQLGIPVAQTNGRATFATSNLSIGTHSITATYNGDSDFISATSNTVAVTVNSSNGGNGGNTNTSYTYYLPFVANNANQFTTYLAFQNVGTASANITITYYDNSGMALTTSTLITQVAQYAEALPTNPFASGKQGTGIITSDQPLNVIVPEATPYGGSAYAVSSGSSNSLIAPFALNNAFGDFTTQLNIFNGGASTVTATVTFYGTVGSSTAITSTSTSVTIQPHTTTNLNQNMLPSGFSGWAQISGTASTLVAQVLEQSPSTKFVAIANAVTSPSSSEFAPAIFNGGYGGFYTGANIINPNSSAVTVTVSYYDLSANATSTTPFEIPAYGVASIFDGATSGNGLPSGGLPSNFIGSMVLSSVGGPVAMSVNENGGVTSAGNSRSGTYAAIATGGSMVGLPVVSNGGYTYITGDTILNTSSQTVTGTIAYYNTDGTAAGMSKNFTIAGHGSQAYYQGDGSLSGGFYGTAVITETSGPANALVVTTNAQNIALFYTYSEPNP